MDLLHAVNFLEIQNGKYADKAARQLDDFKDKAEYMREQGIPVKSWYEFKQEAEMQKPSYMKNALIGAALGAAVMTGIGAVIGTTILTYTAAGGALFGGLVGGYHETENSQHSAKVEAYGKYLELAEKTVRKPPQLKMAPKAPTQTLKPNLAHVQAKEEKPDPVVAPEDIITNGLDLAEKCACAV